MGVGEESPPTGVRRKSDKKKKKKEGKFGQDMID